MDAVDMKLALNKGLMFAKMKGIEIGEFHVHPDVFAILEPILRDDAPDTRSWLQRILRRPKFDPLYAAEFHGIPVIPNEAISPNDVAMRSTEKMDDPNWMKPDREEPAPSAEEAGPSWRDLAKGAVTPTTILIEAMRGMDRVKDVVVLRYLRDGDIELCSTLEKYGQIGALQAALGSIMHGD